MFSLCIGRPVLARYLRYTPDLNAELLSIFPRYVRQNAHSVLHINTNGTWVPLEAGDHIVVSPTVFDGFMVLTEAQFRNQFQPPEDVEITVKQPLLLATPAPAPESETDPAVLAAETGCG